MLESQRRVLAPYTETQANREWVPGAAANALRRVIGRGLPRWARAFESVNDELYRSWMRQAKSEQPCYGEHVYVWSMDHHSESLTRKGECVRCGKQVSCATP